MDIKEKRQFFKIKILLIASMLASGCWAALTMAYLDYLGFSFTLFQIFLMFCSELLFGSLYFLRFLWPKRPMEPVSAQIGHWVRRLGLKGFCLSALFDFLSSIFTAISYLYLPSFAVMGFKMFLILMVAVYRKVYLKRNYYRHQVLGLGLIIVGMLIFTLDLAVLNTNIESTEFFIGMSLMISGQFFVLLDLISMEFYMKTAPAEAETVLSIKGLTGIFICMLSYVPIHYVFDSESHHSAFLTVFVYISDNKNIVGYIIMTIISLGLFNYFLIKTLKLTDSLAVCTIDCGRMILVWVFSFIVFQSLSFEPLEMVASIFSSLGLLIYNEVIILPFFGFDKSAEKTIRENQMFKEIRNNSRTWQTQLDNLVTN